MSASKKFSSTKINQGQVSIIKFRSTRINYQDSTNKIFNNSSKHHQDLIILKISSTTLDQENFTRKTRS
ncbi:unnamed protein product [Chironomus riparius]|uniref:Uncharacterized protein n=1 Tax=Chironomus riparius TaxID=315576 RepID=A0A9N9RK94_9DIPT|nr:unnamed protein product [Chironomus riparius]